jgi:hypothetical protein
MVMSELDRLKEEIAHLRMWLGILVVTDIGLIGWTVSSYGSAKNLLIILAANAIIAVTVAVVIVNRKIEATIERLRDL